MGIIKDYFINQSTIGALKGRDSKVDMSSLNYEESSRFKKIWLFSIVSMIRFAAEFIWMAVGAAVISVIDLLTRYLPNLSNPEFLELSKEFSEFSGLEFTWWVFMLIGFTVWLAVFVSFYLLCRLVVNIISITYFLIKTK